MTYEVHDVQVSRSAGGRRVLAVVSVFAVDVLVAAIAKLVDSGPAVAVSAPGGGAPRAAAGAEGDTATPASRPGQPAAAILPREPALFPLNIARPLPTAIECNDVAPADCHRIVRAALRILPDELPDVRGADVWRSLVCGDTFDCPPDFLRDSDPMGSVILAFDDGPRVAVNVVDWRYGTSVRLGLRAWLTHGVPG